MKRLKEIIQWAIIIIAFFILIFLFSPRTFTQAAELTTIPTAGIIDEIGEVIVNGVEEQIRLEEEAKKAAELAAEQAIKQAQMIAAEEQAYKSRHEKEIIDPKEELKKTNEYRYMVSIIWAESGNQPFEGQKAVGIVVQNRIESSDWPSTIIDVLYQKGQFQPTWNGAIEQALYLYDTGQIPQSCHDAAIYAMTGNKHVDAGWSVVDMSDYYFFNTTLRNPRLILWDHRFK